MSSPSGLLQSGLWPYLTPVLLLFCSNLFMTFAWYGHLKFKSVPLVTVILISWGIAFVEYCFVVPANRFGSAVRGRDALRVCASQRYISTSRSAGCRARVSP